MRSTSTIGRVLQLIGWPHHYPGRWFDAAIDTRQAGVLGRGARILRPASDLGPDDGATLCGVARLSEGGFQRGGDVNGA